MAVQKLKLSACHRTPLVLAGEAAWCRRGAQSLLAGCGLSQVAWLEGSARGLLGGEIDALVVDAHAGLDPDAFGQAAGAVRAGGLLLLLTPPLAHWPARADPQRQRLAVALHDPAEVGDRFLRRLVRVLREADRLTIIEQGEALPVIECAGAPALPQGPTDDQARAIEALCRVATGHRRRPLVLTSDRGRGKSAAFGMAAAELLRAGRRSILVTAPRIDAVDALFGHAARRLEGARLKRGRIVWHDAVIRFVAPDALLQTPVEGELLLVDEAAAIPTPLLEGLLKRYPRIAFATTVHGYEGTGRGFALRFNRILDERSRGWKALELNTPVRWAAHDPLEALVFRLLLLDASAADDDDVAGAEACSIERLERERLVDDEATLSELFGLLVQAHYRTRPFDLRHLLDGPNVSVYVMRHAGHVVATALVTDEGGFDRLTAHAISIGETRPHGHLLPESLAAHLGLVQAPERRCARIMRIAVHPAVQGRGLGSRLIRHIADRARADGAACLGSSFGVSERLLSFWERLQFRPVRLSIRRGAASGAHSVLMLLPLSAAGEELTRGAQVRFARHFVHQLADPLRELPPSLADGMLRASGTATAADLSAADRADLQAFAFGKRVYESCMGPLWELVSHALADPRSAERLPLAARALLIARVLQRRSWQETAALAGLAGRAQVDSAMRAAVGRLIRDDSQPA